MDGWFDQNTDKETRFLGQAADYLVRAATQKPGF